VEISDEERTYLATLRPSRVREVQAGATGWTRVDVIDVEAYEAVALRAVLEQFGIRVQLFPVGQARHLVAALGAEARAPYVVLACHGDEGRILLGELAEEVERFQPVHGSLGPDEVRRFADLPGSVVICTGCDTGTPELADAFLAAGASAYLAPAGAPFGYASVFAPAFLFYELTERRSLEQAVERLRAHDRELAMWRLFQPSG
jgi:hypothetical protein